MTTIPIIYEDDNILILNKPSGLITHAKNKDDKQPSVIDWLDDKYPHIKNIGEPFMASGAPLPRYGVVHRLDKDTSGILVVSKDNESFLFMKDLFKSRKIKKYYLALVHGHLKNPQGKIDSPLGRIGMKRTTRIEGKKMIDQKDAVTEYKVLKRYRDFSLLEVRPLTGRTHQIRVHLNSIGHPVAGDIVYGFKKLAPPEGLSRLFLHAYRLEFKTPSDKSMVIEADLPEELQNVLNVIQ